MALCISGGNLPNCRTKYNTFNDLNATSPFLTYISSYLGFRTLSRHIGIANLEKLFFLKRLTRFTDGIHHDLICRRRYKIRERCSVGTHAPRHNAQGDTSHVYLGPVGIRSFVGLEGKSRGCRFLFRESIDFGYRFAGGYTF